MGFSQRGHDGEVFYFRGSSKKMFVLAEDHKAGHLNGTGVTGLKSDVWTHGNPSPDVIRRARTEHGREARAI